MLRGSETTKGLNPTLPAGFGPRRKEEAPPRMRVTHLHVDAHSNLIRRASKWSPVPVEVTESVKILDVPLWGRVNSKVPVATGLQLGGVGPMGPQKGHGVCSPHFLIALREGVEGRPLVVGIVACLPESHGTALALVRWVWGGVGGSRLLRVSRWPIALERWARERGWI